MMNAKLKRVFIIHGWEADPESNWFPWLKKELEKNGFKAIVPAMPNSAQPKCEEWVDCLKKVIGKVDEETILVGHSLGAITILNYLACLKKGDKVGGVILVSGSDENPGFPELDSFFEIKIDYEKTINTVGNIPTPAQSARDHHYPESGISSTGFMVIHSDNDSVVPLELGQKMAKALKAEFIVIPGGEHLNAGDGFFEFPLVLEKIMSL